MRRNCWSKIFHGCVTKRTLILFLTTVIILLFGYLTQKSPSTAQSYKDSLVIEDGNLVGKDRIFYDNSRSTDSENIFHRENSCETVHIAIVCAGYDASREVVTLIKSILFHRRSPLHVHFIVDKAGKKILSTLFRTWTLPDFTVSFYMSSTLEQKVSWVPNFHYSGVYGLLKLVITDVLPPEIERVIILDIDIVFLSDIGELWSFFMNFLPKNAIGLVENQSDWYLGKISRHRPWPALGRGFNTGVMLVDCKKLRDLKWDLMWSEVAHQVLDTLNGTVLADQDIINAVVQRSESIVFMLPCFWNVQLSRNTDSALCFHKDASKIKLLHWNAPGRLKTKNVPSFLFQCFHTFMVHDGGLLRNPVLRCHSEIDDFGEDVSNSEGDFCRNLLNNVLKPRRVHLFYFQFDYVPDNTRDVTLVTQLSMDRIMMLDSIAEHWLGPISVAIYLSDPETVKLAQFIMNSPVLSKRRNIAYHITFENVGDLTYPVNLLRNIALQQVVTEFVFLSDIDFRPSKNLYDYLTNSVLPSLSNVRSKKAFIIPAFESFHYKQRFPDTKSELIEQWNEGSITPFRSYLWSVGHNATNFTRWRTSREIYSVQWEQNFEPYVVVSKQLCPLYDKRFYGFGWNKVSHIMHLEALRFEFQVVPFGFIVHMPHGPSAEIIKFRVSNEYRECSEMHKTEFVMGLVEKYHIDPDKYVK